MSYAKNSIDNSSLSQLIQQAAPRVVKAVKAAASKTGVDFAYLMEKASVESSFRPDAKAKGSSARGLFQFIDSTWMRMVKTYGAKYGMGKLADSIDDNGHVANPAVKKQILDMRKNPEKSALFAAEYALENKRTMERSLGEGEVGPTEMYMAHFMGAGGATSFLKAYKDNPLQAAADVLPKAAHANRAVFYDKATGQPRTLASIYDYYDQKFKNGGADPDMTDSPDSVFNSEVAQAAAPKQSMDEDAAREKSLENLREFNRMQDKFVSARNDNDDDSTAADSANNNSNNDDTPVYFSPSRHPRPLSTQLSNNETVHWNSERVAVRAPGLVAQPAEIMMMAKLNAPSRNRDDDDSSYID